MVACRTICRAAVVAVLLCGAASVFAQTTNWAVVGWNNLGMHCMDSDYGVFSILPPYNTIHAQIVRATSRVAVLVTNATGYTVSYRAAGDADGSTNTTSVGKTTFWDDGNPATFFGVALAPDQGLPVPGPSYYMPGPANAEQAMDVSTGSQWYAAYGVPITPYDDTLRKNAYPLMRFAARKGTTLVATNQVVLPVSDEMDCRACHASGTQAAARPAAGWIWEPNPERDYRLNILRRHDEQRGTSEVYRAALAANGFQADGLLPTVLRARKPILCAKCHASEALPGSGRPGIPPLTTAVHSRHATAADPDTGVALGNSTNRTACYRCHPGAITRCLRGAMGNAVAADGTPAMQCQSCHGGMQDVGSTNRTGWLDEPNCQACHSGTATRNAGQIRYTSVFTAPGVVRAPATNVFATSTDASGTNSLLYRFSRGHGGLYCEACHGSTHAEFPSSHRNDNVYSINHQGHAGMLAECASCHGGTPPSTPYNGGPHGLHPIGPGWVEGHRSVAESEWQAGRCQPCHGADGKGSVLSRAHGARVLNAESLGVTRTLWRGYTVNCYLCHPGPYSHGSANTTLPPLVQSLVATTGVSQATNVLLVATDPNTPARAVTNRVVSQPANGTVALAVGSATALYTPYASFAGTDTFTYAAYNGQLESNLATVKVVVAGGPYVPSVTPAAFVFTAAGGVSSARVDVAAATPWSAAANHAWIALLSVPSAGGPGVVVFAVERTTGTAARAGSLTVAGRTLAVLQDPALPVDAGTVAMTAIAAAPGQPAAVDYTTVSNHLLQVEGAAGMADAWLGISPPAPGDGLARREWDPAATNAPSRFYRVRVYP